MIISYKYPIFPNKITQWKLAENLDACRWLYNRILQDLNDAKEKGIKLKTYDTQNKIPSGRDPLMGLSFVIWKSQEFLQAPDMID